LADLVFGQMHGIATIFLFAKGRSDEWKNLGASRTGRSDENNNNDSKSSGLLDVSRRTAQWIETIVVISSDLDAVNAVDSDSLGPG
jgi:hypothetical protein